MSEKEIEKKYQRFKHDIERTAKKELKKIKKRIKTLEAEAESVGEETEKLLNSNKKVKK